MTLFWTRPPSRRRPLARVLTLLVVVTLTTVVGGLAPVGASPPTNDDFDDAEDLSGLTIPDWGDPPLEISGDTTDATLEPGEPDWGDHGGSVWFRYTAPAGGFAGQLGVRLAPGTFGFQLTELMAGYPDPWNPGILQPSNLPGQVDRLMPARGNTVVPFEAAPNVSFVRVEPGHTVWFRVTAYTTWGGDGPFTLQLFQAPVGNDPVGLAWDVWGGGPYSSGIGWVGDGTTYQVTPDAFGAAPTVWFTHVFDRPGSFDLQVRSQTANGLASDRPLAIRLYRAPSPDPVTEVGALGAPVAEDSGRIEPALTFLDGSWVWLDEWTTALVDVPVTAGRYYIAVERGSAGGTFFGINDQFTGGLPPPSPQVRIGDASVTEGDAGARNLAFTVTLSEPAATEVTVQVDVVAGSATAGLDYEAPRRTRTLTFAPGRTAKVVNVKVLQDLDVESDETLTVQLSNPSGPYALADGEGVGTILDDDTLPTPNVGIGDVRVYEGTTFTQPPGAGTLTFPITMSSPAPAPASVVATVVAGSADGSDLRLLTRPKLVRFATGSWKKTVSMTLLPDSVVEPDETVTVVLSDPSTGLVIGRSVGTGTVANDD